jgi:tRNA threonylcarbamoyladenosine biosynthesis protein TsaB
MRGRHGGTSAPAEVVSLPAPRGQAYVQHFHQGAPQSAPLVIDPSDPPAELQAAVNMSIVGHRASEIAKSFETFSRDAEITEIARNIAWIAEAKLTPGETPNRPVPLYVRPADAAPPRETPPAILP